MNHPQSRQQNRNTQIKTWKQTLLINKRQIQSTQKDLPKLFSFSTTIPENNQTINKLLKQFQTKQTHLVKQQKKIFHRLDDLNKGINDLKQTLKYYQHTNQYLVKVQNSSQSIYQKISGIKQSMASQFENLLNFQENIQNDLKLYDHKIQLIQAGEYDEGFNKKQSYNTVNPTHNNKENRRVQSAVKRPTQNNIKPTNVKQGQTNDPTRDKQNYFKEALQKIVEKIKFTQNEVQTIQNKINLLGKNLGWNQQDHSDFIKIWNRCLGKNYFEIQEQLGQYFKLYTEEQIRDHMNKFIKYKQLNEQKKQKILQYKQLKQQKKFKQFDILALQQQKKQKIQNKQKHAKKSQEEQIIMKQKVEQWKRIKQEKKKQEQEAKRLQQQRKRMEKHRKIQQNILRKQYVQKWKQQQQQIRTKKLKQSQSTKTQIIDKQTQQRIRQRQQKLIQQKIQKVMKKKYQQEEKLQKQQKLKEKKLVKYSYVNSKLEEKTTAIKEKQREKFDGKNKKDANTFGGNLLHVGVRATPAWMQGI